MAGVSIAFLFVLFALVAPLALYWFVREEDPDPDRTTSWNEARDRASEDVYGNRNRDADSSDDRTDGRTRRDRDSRTDDGNHWG